MTDRSRLSRVAALAVAAAAVLAGPAAACPFCNSQGTTLTGDAAQASMILFGTLSNAKLDAGGEFGQGTTDLTIEVLVKPNDILGDKKVITLPRYVPADKGNPVKYLVFCDVYQGKIDPYRGLAVKPDSPIATYLKKAIEVKDKDVVSRLQFFFPYLESSDPDVSGDAYTEFGNVDYRDFRPVAEKLPADTVAGWLQNPGTSAARYGLYGSILGHCGRPEHAALLRKLLDDPNRRFSSGMDGILAGYVMLDRKAGWEYLHNLLRDGGKDMIVRYAGLRTVRFLWDFRPDLIPHEELVKGLDVLLNQPDIADLAIEDLRKWERWERAGQVLALYGKPGFDVPVIKRSILRYALSCPPEKSPEAAAFVAKMRKENPDWVADAEELLKLEASTASKPAAVTPKPANPPPARQQP
jgi:hypothetical protein